jgi:hypothetical protein
MLPTFFSALLPVFLFDFHCAVFYLKRNVSGTGFCLHLQVEPTKLGSVNRATLCLRTWSGGRIQSAKRFLLSRRQGYRWCPELCSYINILSSKIYRSYSCLKSLQYHTYLDSKIYFPLAVPGHALLWPFPVTNRMILLRSSTSLFFPARIARSPSQS